jgi:asparagine synthase (glutamine-hydrolysing)
VDRSVIETMNDQIEHRGPDDEGYFVRRGVGMAMRRLSIIDLASGQQPISNEDGSVAIVFNGEIYNYRALRAELQARGHLFATSSDTETIVHAYEEFGKRCVEHLRGMFAFAIWDERRQQLFVARDRLGIKPLYFHVTGDTLSFASEIKALLAHPGIEAELDRSCLPEYLAFGYLTGSHTMFRGIHKLMPGHTVTVTLDGELDFDRYWDLSAIDVDGHRSKRYYVQGYRDLLEECVESHLMSEVPLGVFLSGGLDSSTIAALTKKMVDGPVETFSVGYDAPESELSYARTVAEHLGTVHHEVSVGPRDFFDALPGLIWHEDEPLVWPSSVSLYFVSRLARERVTVVLTGEGSDETLGGYSRYALSTWNARLDRMYKRTTPRGFRRWVRSTIEQSRLLGDDHRRRLQHCFFGRDLSKWPDWYFEEFYVAISESEQSRLLHPDLQSEPGAALRTSLDCWEATSGDPIKRLLQTDISSYLIELLMKQDNMSMATSVESRVPFLDHELVEFALQIPSRYNVRGLSGKRVLKEAVADLLPSSIIHRRKMGFPTPLRSWLRGPELDRIENMLLSTESLNRRLFARSGLTTLFAEHRARQHDHTDRIWRLLNLEQWCRIFLDQAPAPEVARATRQHAGSSR